MMHKRGCRCLIGAMACLWGSAPGGSTAFAADTPLTTVRVASGLTLPLYVTHAPGDFHRIFIVGQRGIIYIVKDGTLLSLPFLDIRALVKSGGELGLLGLAFHPRFQENGFFYVNYTSRAFETVVARYHASADPDVADPMSGTTLLSFPQPSSNHNGGWLSFGPDGYLYIATGDGGSEFDVANRGQTIVNNMLGKLLRIDVDHDDWPGDPSRNYAIPPDNPFVGAVGDDEIWAYGLRNPWRCAFDRLTGDLYIADVGQDLIEEIDFQPASSLGGENYGWRCMEGSSCTGRSGCECNDPSLTLPLYEYDHSFGCSITGGEVYRGCSIPDLRGAYFFADFCSNRIWTLRRTVTSFIVTEHTTELAPGGELSISSISSFGTDAFGELYICDLFGGEVFKIVRAAPEEPIVLLGSDPPNGAIDARQPFEPDGSAPAPGWQTITMTVSGCSNRVGVADLNVSETGALDPPRIIEIQPVGPSRVQVALDRGISRGEWTTLALSAAGGTVRLGWLPGDVNGDGRSTRADLSALLKEFEGVEFGSPLWSFDIDGSGSIAPSDVLRLIDLLNGAGAYDSYEGAALP